MKQKLFFTILTGILLIFSRLRPEGKRARP